MPPRRTRSVLALFGLFVVVPAACGGSPTTAQNASQTDAELACPAPIGAIPRESCADFADDFGALDVSGALKLVGASKGAEIRIEAIRAAGDLATKLKDERVALCERYNACKVPPAEHTAEDARLASLMTSLITAWDARKFSDPESVARFRSTVTSLSEKLEGGAAASTTGSATAASSSKTQRFTGDTLAKIEGPGLTFRAASGSITITSTTEGNHDALRGTTDKLYLLGGAHYLVRVHGSFTPTTPALIAPGDELTVRLKYRAAQAGEAYIALRSLEDPDATESTATFPVAANASGTHQATLFAAPGSSGFYIGVGSKDAGVLELDDVEIVRQNAVIAAARAEAQTEPNLKTTCALSTKSALAGKNSFRCEASKEDRLTLGNPPGHLYLAIRSAGAERASLRTLSLEGGRSLDATLKENAELIIGLTGPGSATLSKIEVEKLAK